MPNHHPQPSSDRPTARQQRYLRSLAERTGTTFTPPKTKAEASREIDRLQRRTPDRRSDQARERKQVTADLQTGVDDAVRHQASETTGYGSSARWTQGAETGR